MMEVLAVLDDGMLWVRVLERERWVYRRIKPFGKYLKTVKGECDEKED